MRTKIIFSDKEWEDYKASFSVGSMMHVPKVPPSFPVLVTSVLAPNPYYQSHSSQAQHSFIEAADLKRMLGVS